MKAVGARCRSEPSLSLSVDIFFRSVDGFDDAIWFDIDFVSKAETSRSVLPLTCRHGV